MRSLYPALARFRFKEVGSGIPPALLHGGVPLPLNFAAIRARPDRGLLLVDMQRFDTPLCALLCLQHVLILLLQVCIDGM